MVWQSVDARAPACVCVPRLLALAVRAIISRHHGAQTSQAVGENARSAKLWAPTLQPTLLLLLLHPFSFASHHFCQRLPSRNLRSALHLGFVCLLTMRGSRRELSRTSCCTFQRRRRTRSSISAWCGFPPSPPPTAAAAHIVCSRMRVRMHLSCRECWHQRNTMRATAWTTLKKAVSATRSIHLLVISPFRFVSPYLLYVCNGG